MYRVEFSLVELRRGGEATLLRLRPPEDRAIAVRRVVLLMAPAGVSCSLSLRAGRGESPYTQRVPVVAQADSPASRTAAEEGFRRPPTRSVPFASLVFASRGRVDLNETALGVRRGPAVGVPVHLSLATSRAVSLRGMVYFDEADAPAAGPEESAGAAAVVSLAGPAAVSGITLVARGTGYTSTPTPISSWTARLVEDPPPDRRAERLAILVGRFGLSAGEAEAALRRIEDVEAAAMERYAARRDRQAPGPEAPMPDVRDAGGRRAIVPPHLLAEYRAGRLTHEGLCDAMGCPRPAPPEPERPRPRRRIVRPEDQGGGL